MNRNLIRNFQYYFIKNLLKNFSINFIISVSFAFNGAFTALMMENQSKIARFCGYYSIASMASAISVLMFAIFRQVGQQLQTSSS